MATVGIELTADGLKKQKNVAPKFNAELQYK
jgi:hypothetical protein